MQESGSRELVQLDGEAMAAIAGGAPSTSTSFWYDLFWVAGWYVGRAVDAVQWVADNAGTGSYTYGKVGTT